MKRFRWLLLAVSFILVLAAVSAAGAEETAADGFIMRAEDDRVIITGAEDSAVLDGVVTLPEEINGLPVTGYEPSLVREGIRLVICSRGTYLYSNEDNAPDSTLRYCALNYASFRQLSANEMDRLPEIRKGEYALTDYYQVSVARNGSSSTFFDGTEYLSESDIPQELFGQKAYSLIDADRIAKKEGDWVYTSWGDDAILRQYTGTAEKVLVIPDTLGGMQVREWTVDFVPPETETVYLPIGMSRRTLEDKEPRSFLCVEYASYEWAQQYRSRLLEEYPAFTEDVYAVAGLSAASYIGGNYSENSPEGLLREEDLLSEINGKKLITDPVSEYFEKTEGGWTYTCRHYSSGENLAVITGYTGESGESFVVPGKINGMRVNNICLSAIPETAKYVYIPEGVSLETGDMYNAELKDRSFIRFIYTDYQYARDNGSYLLDSYPAFTDGMTAISNVDLYSYSAEKKRSSYDGLREDLTADRILAEIDGNPVFLGAVRGNLSYKSGEYVYTMYDDNRVLFRAGPYADGMMIVPSRIDGMEVMGYYVDAVPEEVTAILAPSNASNWGSSKVPHTVTVYQYQDYDMLHSDGKNYDSTGKVKPGEYLVHYGYIYTPEGSESLKQDYYLYPTSAGGHKVHLNLSSNEVTQYKSGKYTYYKVSPKEIHICAFSDNDARKVSIPSTLDDLTVVGIKSLNYNTVFYVSNAESITLPKKLRIIGSNAIYSNKIKKIKLPSGLKEIGNSALQLHGELSKLEIPDTVTSIGPYFLSGWNLKKVTIPDSVTDMASGALRGLSGATEIRLPSGIREIPEELCTYCSSLESITIPKNVTAIGKNAFQNCSNLQKVTFKGSKVKKIGDNAFADCGKLSKIELKDGLEEIGTQAFYNCAAVKEITIPSSVTKIGEYAFNGCKGMTKITLGSKVKSIAGNAFADCNKKKLTFYAPKGSYAYEWAKKKGFKVKEAK